MDPNDTSNKKDEFLEFLKKLKLDDKFPQKITIKDAMTISKETLGFLNATDQYEVLPFLILQKIMMSDSTCRSCLFQKKKIAKSHAKYKTLSDNASDSESDSDCENDDDDKLHPVDCILALIHCCDDILRQEIISKMSLCQLAVPFLLPNPENDSITFLLWAMRSIVKSWKSYNNGEKECRIVNYNAPLISFLRLGEQKSYNNSSKSEILNTILGDDFKRFFYWRVCAGGDYKRKFVDGLVELCCYFPTGKDASYDSFNDAFMFLNLRGDAQKHPKQVNFLSKVSFISFVIIDEASILKNEYTDTLNALAEASGGIVLLLAENRDDTSENIGKKLKTLYQKLPKSKCCKIKLKNKNLETIKKEIIEKLLEKISASSDDLKSIAQCCKAAEEAGILIDENTSYCKIGEKNANEIMEIIRSKKLKHEMLPLQGPEYWHKWAKFDKEKHRHTERRQNSDIAKYSEEKEAEKIKIRQYQYEKKWSLVMECFLKYLRNENVDERKYFLQWLKLLLDDHSRSVLPQLHAEYQKTRNQLIELKQKNYVADDCDKKIEKLTEILKLQNKELILASFGIEHLFREVGQIYEARAASNGYNVPLELKQEAENFSQVMAEIMSEGYSLELMDGDASHVPLSWVSAVIKQLKNICGRHAGNKHGGKIFVLSVLGVQSTGKSTLLNTIFGLHFNVSAGRCTRGAYIQLLPLNNILKSETNCDYLLVIDTEGVRAPELQLEGPKHDNELATFVIGVADATIINIFGETEGNLDDILQTSLHAFIRMKKVEMNPSCVFVHQNVPDPLAKSKSLVGKQKFHNKLDTITLAAAKIENCNGHYKSFCDIISFNDSKDVFYFSSLWKGDPPMAPVNDGYILHAYELKASIIQLIKRKKSCLCSLEVFKSRIENLWTAILQENFVFSFKSALEVSAFNELDSKYCQWSWEFKYEVLNWENTTSNEINSSDPEENSLEMVKSQCINIALTLLNNQYKILHEKIERFIEASEHSETLMQWKDKTEKRSQDLRNESLKEAERFIDDLVKTKLNQAEIDKSKKEYITELQTHIKDLSSKLLNGKELSAHEQEQEFENKWKKWMEDFQTKKIYKVKYPTDSEIELAIGENLIELMQAQKPKLINKLAEKSLSTRGGALELDVIKEVHLSSTKWFGCSIGQNDMDKAKQLTSNYIAKAKCYLKSKRTELFHPKFVYEMLKPHFDSIDLLANREENSKFLFTAEYKIDLSLLLCSYALQIFIAAKNKIKKDNDPIEKLRALKNTFWCTFKNQYSNNIDEKAAAESLCKLIEKSIEKAVKSKLEGLIVKDLKDSNSCFCSKRGFKIVVLKKLAIKEDFNLYKQYLDDIDGCFRYWTYHFLEIHCLKIYNNKSKISTLAEQVLLEITDKIKEIVQMLRNGDNIKFSNWLRDFHTNLQGTFVINKIELEEIVGIYSVNDYEIFSLQLENEIKQIENKWLRIFLKGKQLFREIENGQNPPHLSLYNSLIGCTATCPFCKEQCEKTISLHPEKHNVSLHRPGCLGKFIDRDTDKLFLKTCTQSIISHETFECSVTSDLPVPYHEYNKFFPTWYITTTASFEPDYWKWFITRFEKQLVSWAEAKGADIPPYWKDISRDAALDNLSKII